MASLQVRQSPTGVTSLANLPDELLQQIFVQCGQRDIEVSKRVCKRIQNFVNKNRQRLPRTRVAELSARLRRLDEGNIIGKLRKTASPKLAKMRLELDIRRHADAFPTCSKTVVSDEFDESSVDLHLLGETLRELHVDRTLSFQCMAIDSGVYEELARQSIDLSNANTLAFLSCHFNIPSFQFGEILRRTQCRRLSLEFCTIDGLILNDQVHFIGLVKKNQFALVQVLEAMPNCERLDVKLRHARTFPTLTDRTLKKWSGQTSLPVQINLAGTASEFTLEGIVEMIKAYQNRGKTTDSYEWDFGRVQLPEDLSVEQLLTVFSFPGLAATVDSGNQDSPIDRDTFHVELHEKMSPFGNIFTSTATARKTPPQICVRFQLVKSVEKNS